MNKRFDGGVFTGSVDEFLTHCASLDMDLVEQCVNDENKQLCLEYIMNECECSEEEAQVIYDEIQLTETKKIVDDLVKDGLVKIIGHNEDGDPLFGLTELGEELQKQIKKP